MFVMEMTARKTAYYKIFMAAKCKRRCFEDAWKLFDEMREYGCEPTVKPYNYLLGSLCKNGLIEEGCRLLEGLGYLPDAITFEVLAVHACKVGRSEFALEFLGRMLEAGVQPRTSTHAVFIKSYFLSGREGCAHEYVISMSEKDKWTSCGNYTLLAKLFHESGRLKEAYKIIMEMMGKGLLPNFNVYVKVLKDAHKKLGGKATSELKQKYVNLCSTIKSWGFHEEWTLLRTTSSMEIPAGGSDQSALVETWVEFHKDQQQFMVANKFQIAILEATKLERRKQWTRPRSWAPITHSIFSCDGQLVYASFQDATVCVFSWDDLKLLCRISPSVYLPANVSSNVYPLVIAAHPKLPNQFANGMTDGVVHLFEPLMSEDDWGSTPPAAENRSTSSSSTAPATRGAGSKGQRQR